MPATPMLLARMPHVGVPYLLQRRGRGGDVYLQLPVGSAQWRAAHAPNLQGKSDQNCRMAAQPSKLPSSPAAVEDGGQEAALAHALQLVAVGAHLCLHKQEWHNERLIRGWASG